jgi:hypothetical protein
MLSQSAWRPSGTGWTCSIALRRTSLPGHTRVIPLDVHITDEALSRETDSPDLWIRARDLVTEHFRHSATNDLMPAHLGEVMIR